MGLRGSGCAAKLDQRLSLWILSTRMFPPIVTAVPLFLMMRDLRLLNTITSLVIVYTALNLPFVVWMMRGFFRELPRELEEAAMVDGDSRLGALVTGDSSAGHPGTGCHSRFLPDRIVERVSACAGADPD